MKNLLFLFLLSLPTLIFSQDDPIKERIKDMKFEGKPKKIIITFPDSIDVHKVMSLALLRNGAPITNSDASIGMITTDYFTGSYSKKIRQNCLVFIEGKKATITGRYYVKEQLYDMVLEGDAQAKSLGTSVYRNAFYNLIYVFRDYIDQMTFE